MSNSENYDSMWTGEQIDKAVEDINELIAQGTTSSNDTTQTLRMVFTNYMI